MERVNLPIDAGLVGPQAKKNKLSTNQDLVSIADDQAARILAQATMSKASWTIPDTLAEKYNFEEIEGLDFSCWITCSQLLY